MDDVLDRALGVGEGEGDLVGAEAVGQQLQHFALADVGRRARCRGVKTSCWSLLTWLRSRPIRSGASVPSPLAAATTALASTSGLASRRRSTPETPASTAIISPLSSSCVATRTTRGQPPRWMPRNDANCCFVDLVGHDDGDDGIVDAPAARRRTPPVGRGTGRRRRLPRSGPHRGRRRLDDRTCAVPPSEMTLRRRVGGAVVLCDETVMAASDTPMPSEHRHPALATGCATRLNEQSTATQRAIVLPRRRFFG